jgi:ribosomal protein S27AE
MVQGLDSTKICPRCGNVSLTLWDKLDEDQKLLTEKLPASADYTMMERKKHRFCTRCWFEEVSESSRLA